VFSLSWRSKYVTGAERGKAVESLNISIEIRLYFQATWIHAKASFNIKYKYRRGEIKNESSGDRYKDIYMALDIEMGEGQGDLLC
jgi:hypothetical protein